MADDAIVRIILQESGSLSTQSRTTQDNSTSTNQPTLIGSNSPAALERKQTAEIVYSIEELKKSVEKITYKDNDYRNKPSSIYEPINNEIRNLKQSINSSSMSMGLSTGGKGESAGQLDYLKSIADHTKDTSGTNSEILKLLSKQDPELLKSFKDLEGINQTNASIDKRTESIHNVSKMIMEKLYESNIFNKETGAEDLRTIEEEMRLGINQPGGIFSTDDKLNKLTGAGKTPEERAAYNQQMQLSSTSQLPIEFGKRPEGVSQEELAAQMVPKIKQGKKINGRAEALGILGGRLKAGVQSFFEEGFSDTEELKEQLRVERGEGGLSAYEGKQKVPAFRGNFAEDIPPEQMAQLYAQAAAARESEGFYPKPKPELAGLPEDFAAPFAPTVELWEEPPQEQLPTPPKPDTQLKSAKKTDLGIPDPEDVQLQPPPTKFESITTPEPEDREEDYIFSLGEQTKSVLPSKLELQDDSAERLAKAWEEFDANPPHHGTGWHLPRTEDNPGGYTEEHLAELGEVGLGPHGSIITKAIYEEMVMERRRRGNLYPPTFAQGGWVGDHPGEPKGKDTIPAWLSEGEFVVNPDAAAKNRGTLEEINSGQTKYMAEGGSVTKAEKASLWEFGRIGEMLVAPIKNMAMGTLGGAKWAAGANSDPAQSISSFGGAITSAGQALGKFLPVVGGVTEAAGMVVQSFAALMQEIDKTVDRYGQYSPEIQQAKAIAEIRQTLGDMQRAQEAGAELAEYVLTKSNMEQKFEEAKIKILVQIVPLVTQVLEAIIAVVPTGDGIEKAIINLTGPLWALTEWMGQGVRNQKDANLKELEDPTEMILRNKNFSEDNGQRGDWVPNL